MSSECKVYSEDAADFAVLAHLESLPATFEPPIITDETVYQASLHELLERNPTAKGRHTVLLAAAHLTPTEAWGTTVIEWVDDGDEDEVISGWILAGLTEGTFSFADWVRADNIRLHDMLIVWGTRDFESFLTACTTEFFRPESRLPLMSIILSTLLSDPYVPATPSSNTLMSQLPSHPFFDALLQSLIFDTGNHLFPLALRVIFISLPFNPVAVIPHVPVLMIVLGRAVCWRDRPFVDADSPPKDAVTRTPLPASDWKVATSAMEPSANLPIQLQPERVVRLLVVAMYGGWPSNVLAFVRDPVMYLQSKSIASPYNVPFTDVYPPGVLAARTGPLLGHFSLHPSLITHSSGAELKDGKRWEKTDPADFVSKAHLIARSGNSTTERFDFLDAPETREVEVLEKTAPLPATEVTDDVKRLHRENELLRIEAKFSDRTRNQYLFHIARLHKNSLRFSSDEAEIHSFVNRLKEQSKTITSLTDELAQQRLDTAEARRKHQNWQAGLREKIDKLKQEKKTWQEDAKDLRGELSEAQAVVERQKAELADVKNKDDDVKRCKEAKAEAEQWRGKCYEASRNFAHLGRPHLEPQTNQLLEAARKQVDAEKAANASLEARLSHSRTPSRTLTPTGRKTPVPQSLETFQEIASEAKKRAERAERENLDLKAELERLRGEPTKDHDSVTVDGDRSFIWGANE
ncbi:hypothetical protein P7C73_g6052, partial [Tremellales sp. Uapishka_1]